MYNKFNIGNTDMCTCEQAPQTAEHILQNCIERDSLRHDRRTVLAGNSIGQQKYKCKKT